MFFACSTLLQAPGRATPQRPGPRRSAERLLPCSKHHGPVRGPAAGLQRPGISSSRQQRWQLVHAARAADSGDGGSSGAGDASSSSSSSSSSKGKQKPGPKTHTAEPQPELQAWLEQQQGLPAAAADEHARRLAHVFGSQQAALDGLPAIFYFCTSQGLTGLQTAQLLDRIARFRRDKVTGFAATTQQEWLLLEACVAAHVQRQRLAVKQLPTHTSFASVAGSKTAAVAKALGMPPGHVEAWLAAVRQRLSDADIGRLLLKVPEAVTHSPETALAAMAWAVDELQVPEAELGGFLARSVRLLMTPVSTLQGNLAALQQALQQCGLPPELASQLAGKEPQLLMANSGTVQAAAAWLAQRFPDATQLQPVLERGPLLLACRVERLERTAGYLRRELGWRNDDGQLEAFIRDYPQAFACLDLESEEKQHMLRFLTRVVGVSATDCLVKWSSYLKSRLETTAARYMLVQERAPQLLYGRGGALSLTWVIRAPNHLPKCGAATKAEVLAFEREWPRNEEGRRLLAALRNGSTEGWPRPGAPLQELAQLADTPARKARRERRQGQHNRQ